jgi:hypothetical protein
VQEVFESENEPAKDRTDYTGLKILGILAPIFFLFVFFDKAEMGFTVILVLGMIMLAIKIRWRLRYHLWFWATIALVLAFHLPLFLIARWRNSNAPTLAYSLPFGIADFLIILGALSLAEKIFSRDPSSDDDNV